jgi:threonine dehydrogenase-like Zn-dependent dehydrogenase
MKALVFDKELKLVDDYKKPVPKEGEALVRVTLAGICNTDYEITKGYMGYVGILGHEAVGIVEDVNINTDKCHSEANKQEILRCAQNDAKAEESPNSTNNIYKHPLIGKRVVPEISYGCKDPNCEWCAKHNYRHCPNRHTLGIWHKDGVFAQYFTMPVEVLFEVPDNVADEQAVFTEPLAAALEINEQLHIKPMDKVVVLGDGKLGLITAIALNAQNLNVTLVGKHQNKLDIARAQGVKTALLNDFKIEKIYDVVVEATGSVNGFETSLALTKPRGVLVLKSTVATGKELNLAPIVIDEITVLGSRCGQFPPALRLLESGKIDLTPLISATYEIDNAIEAFEKNKEKDTLKVLLKI